MTRIHIAHRKNERGITIVLVAFSLLALLGMAALAIDFRSDYRARRRYLSNRGGRGQCCCQPAGGSGCSAEPGGRAAGCGAVHHMQCECQDAPSARRILVIGRRVRGKAIPFPGLASPSAR